MCDQRPTMGLPCHAKVARAALQSKAKNFIEAQLSNVRDPSNSLTFVIVGLSPRKGLRQDDCKSRKSSDKWQRDEGLGPDIVLLVKWGFALSGIS